MAIGYACLTIGVQGTELSRCNLKNATVENISKITRMNLSALEKMIDYNCKNEIMLFRISSDIIPFGSHPVNTFAWWEEDKDFLLQLGRKITEAGIRVSMHPGQYTVINSNQSEVVERSVKELIYHALFLDSLGMDEKSKLVLHIGGVYGNKEEAMNNFITQYHRLPNEVKKRLILENDEKNYNIKDVLQISEATGAPVVFDNLHHKLNPPPKLQSDAEWIKRCKSTWTERDGRQKIHYSQQKDGANKGSHSVTIFLEPFLEYYKGLADQELDIMLEVKDKNLSAIKCIKAALHDSTAKELEGEWARYKYYVLSKSANAYQEIRELLKDKTSHVASGFYQIIEKANLLEENTGAEVNAAQHVWGYISKDSTKTEKRRYEQLMEAYTRGSASIQPVKNHILKCAQTRGLDYLIQSLYFYL